MVDWQTLLSTDRYSTNESVKPSSTKADADVTVFSEDAERILYSSPFRRMQGKTQVHPLPISDYVRTRLTHTIEVAHAGRTIAAASAKRLKRDYTINANLEPFGDIVYAACLAHDIGNPPFGHIGEYAIQTWFFRNKDKFETLGEVLDNPNYQGDFLKFDGNAQGFRVLTRLSGWRQQGGLQLSYATVGAFTKYPFGSGENSIKKRDASKREKFGYMHADEAAARKIFSGLGLKYNVDHWSRHPLAFIVEAADDICYLTTDIEDAVRAGTLNFLRARDLLSAIGSIDEHLPRIDSITDENDKLAYMRAGAVSVLIDKAYNQFCEAYPSIIAGNEMKGLLPSSAVSHLVEDIRKECRTTVYKDKAKLEIEAAGFNVILTLMDLYGGMIHDYIRAGEDGLDRRSEGLYHIMPKEFRVQLKAGNAYESYLVLLDYISGMTDRFALDQFRKLTGNSVRLSV